MGPSTKKARVASLRTSERNAEPQEPKKRYRKARDSCKEKEKAATLRTSSRRKRKIDNYVPRTKAATRVKGIWSTSNNCEQNDDTAQDLRLAFSNLDESAIEQKGISAAGTRSSSFLKTLLSPVYLLFKGADGEASSSHANDFEETDCLKENLGGLMSNEEEEGRVEESVLLASCPLIPYTDTVAMENEKDAYDINGNSMVNNTMVDEEFSDQCVQWPLTYINTRDSEQQEECLDEEMLDSDCCSSFYLGIKQAKPVDSSNQENIQAEALPDEDNFFAFDSCLFIKHLPKLSEVIPSSRSLLLPKQTRRCPPKTLVLDLDETLVHSTLGHCEDADFTFSIKFNSQIEHTVYVRKRPHLQMFMERVAQMFEIIVFTASQSIYAEQLLNLLDPKRKLIRHRIYRESCVCVEGIYLKDLTILGRDLAKVAIIDNSPEAFGFQIDNGIPIESWFEDRSDSALAALLPFLETLVTVDDMRPLIADKFKLREKVAAAPEFASR